MTYVANIKLRSPLVHGTFGPSTGNATLCRRMPVIHGDRIEEVPVLSGNALRGKIRRLAWRHLFGVLGMTPSDRLYSLTATGGFLDGKSATIDPMAVRALRDAVPLLSVLGSALGNWMLPGRVSIGIGWPKCDVTYAAGLVSREISHLERESGVPSLADIQHEISHVRLPERTLVGDASKSMPHSFEGIATGTRLESRLIFDPETTLTERACIGWALERITTLGGKQASGMGQVSIETGIEELDYAEWLEDPTKLEAARAALTGIA